MKPILVLFFVALAMGASALPATYDQRQDGAYNVRADVQNIALIAGIPASLREQIPASAIVDLLANWAMAGRTSGFKKRRSDKTKQSAIAEEPEDFIESRSPYAVDISRRSDTGFYGKDDDMPVPEVLEVKDNQYVSPKM